MDLLYQKTSPRIPIYGAYVLWFKRLHGNNTTVHNDLNERIVEQLRRDMPLLVWHLPIDSFFLDASQVMRKQAV